MRTCHPEEGLRLPDVLGSGLAALRPSDQIVAASDIIGTTCQRIFDQRTTTFWRMSSRIMEQQQEMAVLQPKASVDSQGFTQVPTSDDEAETKPHSLKLRRLWPGRFNDYWIWEAILCVGSAVALICIVGVLKVYDGKPLPEWPYGTTINSVLSWITQILTACMVGAVAPCLSQSKWIYFSAGKKSLDKMDSYDWASRGPLGCLAFMWTSKMRYVLCHLGSYLLIRRQTHRCNRRSYYRPGYRCRSVRAADGCRCQPARANQRPGNGS